MASDRSSRLDHAALRLDEFRLEERRDGTLSPSRRASEIPMAMACFLFFTLRRPPDFNSPCLNSCITLPILLLALRPYLRREELLRPDEVERLLLEDLELLRWLRLPLDERRERVRLELPLREREVDRCERPLRLEPPAELRRREDFERDLPERLREEVPEDLLRERDRDERLLVAMY